MSAFQTPIPRLAPWRVEDFFGALFVIVAFASLGVTLWFGWPEVSSWLSSQAG